MLFHIIVCSILLSVLRFKTNHLVDPDWLLKISKPISNTVLRYITVQNWASKRALKLSRQVTWGLRLFVLFCLTHFTVYAKYWCGLWQHEKDNKYSKCSHREKSQQWNFYVRKWDVTSSPWTSATHLSSGGLSTAGLWTSLGTET